ncbi:uncharacterized protein LOC121419871 [Lytechinus variegatus]|uniref:uncharacterized protein LOC121419798 n=1 Tax=Lytechinus variegatus TaxID=7654 RepID=UPI001BB23E33|nr:uncharacterized protein LOC121419798 [Lytechinus variegatus]XP_041470267.1 uncharacterized protein LOC121419871 [Lytechinus variegatus]
MNVIAVFVPLFCMFTSGEAITCIVCSDITTTNNAALNLTVLPPATCGKPQESNCTSGVKGCMTVEYKITLMHKTEGKIVLTSIERGCAPPNHNHLIPDGNACLNETSTAIFASLMYDPATALPPNLGATYDSHQLSLCVCDSEDLCTPPEPTSPTNQTVPSAEPTPDMAHTITTVASDDTTLPDSHGCDEDGDSAAKVLVASSVLVVGSLLNVLLSI